MTAILNNFSTGYLLQERQTKALSKLQSTNRFFRSQNRTTQDHILESAMHTAQLLEQWAAQYPDIRRVRIWPLALSVAAAAPFSNVEAMVSTARMSLWVFTLDDLFDENNLMADEMMQRVTNYQGIVQDQDHAQINDNLAAALCEIKADLAKYPLFRSLAAKWQDALYHTIQEMKREYDWRLLYQRDGLAALPSYKTYLSCGRYSIGGPPHIWSALITINDPSTPQFINYLETMEQIASICIRLSNDIQSYAREVDEGKFNSLVILQHLYQKQGLSLAEAYRQAIGHVQADIDKNLNHLQQFLRNSNSLTGQPEKAIVHIAQFVCEFYNQHDYHTFVQ